MARTAAVKTPAAGADKPEELVETSPAEKIRPVLEILEKSAPDAVRIDYFAEMAHQMPTRVLEHAIEGLSQVAYIMLELGFVLQTTLNDRGTIREGLPPRRKGRGKIKLPISTKKSVRPTLTVVQTVPDPAPPANHPAPPAPAQSEEDERATQKSCTSHTVWQSTYKPEKEDKGTPIGPYVSHVHRAEKGRY